MTAIGLYHLKQLGMNVTDLLQSSAANIHQQTTQCLNPLADFMLCYLDSTIEADTEVLYGFSNAVQSWYHFRELGILPSHYSKPHSPGLSCCLVNATIKDSLSISVQQSHPANNDITQTQVQHTTCKPPLTVS